MRGSDIPPSLALQMLWILFSKLRDLLQVGDHSSPPHRTCPMRQTDGALLLLAGESSSLLQYLARDFV